MKFESTKVIELGSTAFRQWRAKSHCRFIHGYRLTAKFWFNCIGLDENGWVVDFGGLKDLKNILCNQFDHTLCIAADDPLREVFEKLHHEGGCDLRIMEKGVGIERFAEFAFDVADKFIREKTVGRCWVEKVEIWEHESNSGITRYNLADILPSCRDPKIVRKRKTDEGYSDEITQIQEEVVEPTPVEPTTVNTTGPIPVPIRNPVTSGWSDPFAGTSWGSR